jgi:DNA-binding protein HU-beta
MSLITKTELVTLVAKESGVDSKVADSVVSAALNTITKSLKAGKEVRLTGFGTFAVSAIAARSGRNPRTGETIQIAATKRPVFKAGKTLKDTVNS